MGESNGDPPLAPARSDLLKRLQEAQDRAARLEAAFDAAPYGVVIFETRHDGPAIVDFVWNYVNPAAARLLAQEGADLLGKRLRSEAPAIHGEGLFERYARVVETGEPDTHEIEGRQGGPRRCFRAVAVKAGDGLSVTFAESAAHASVERSVEAERRRLSDVLSHVPASVGLLEGPDHRYVLANRGLRQLYRNRPFLGLPARDVHPELRSTGLLSLLDEVYATGERAVLHEFKIEIDRENNGALEEGFFDFVYEPLRDPQGRVHGILAFAVERTDKVNARRRIEALASEYQFLADAMPQLIWRLSSEGSLDYANERLVRYLGVQRQELLGQGWDMLEVIHPDDLDDARRQWEKSLLTGQVTENESRVRGADGSYRWHLSRGVPMRDAEGNILQWYGSAIDIEERKQMEQQLRRREEEFRALAENLPVLAWSAQPDGNIDFYNRRWYEYTGTTVEDLRGWGWKSVVEPAMLDEVSARWRRSLDTGEPFEMELQLRGADGAFQWFITRVHPLRDEHGRILRWFGTSSNIDEQRRISDEREMFQALVEASGDLIAIATPEGRLLYLNRAGRRLLGVGDQDDITKRTMAEFFDEEWLSRAVTEIIPELLAGRRWKGETVCKNLATGEQIPVYTNAIGIPGPEPGSVRLLAEVARDLRPQKAAEAERVSLLASLDLLAKAGSVLASSLDVETTLQNVAHLIAPALASFCTVSLEDSAGATQLVAVAHEDPPREALVRDAFVRYGLPTARDPEHREMLNELGAVTAITVPLAVSGRTLGAMTLASTASDRRSDAIDAGLAEELARRVAVALDNARLFEAAQIERRRAEEANQAKDDFLATVSHELRTPLSAMLGWTQMLRGGDFDADRRAKALDTIERNARAQAQLIEDLLDISRIITGNLRLDVRPMSLVQVVEAAIEAVRPAAEAKGVRIQSSLDPEVGAILGDPDRLQQVVWNLLSNAVKFTSSRGLVEVRLRQIGSHVEIAVEDNGRGIAPDFLPHVFERFRQAEGGAQRGPGLGLGLAIVKHIVDLHGGTIRASSEGTGRGATFVVRLPIAPVQKVNLPTPRSSAEAQPHHEGLLACRPELRGLRVLVVDDEQDARDLTVALLEPSGIEVTTAASAREALDSLKATRPDVLVSDIGMPEEDGHALIQSVRALPAAQGGQTPAVALTAYARAEDRTRALLAGFTMHVPKPVEPAELLVALATVSGRLRAGHEE
jgi:PAS domain S-box-containing protein